MKHSEIMCKKVRDLYEAALEIHYETEGEACVDLERVVLLLRQNLECLQVNLQGEVDRIV